MGCGCNNGDVTVVVPSDEAIVASITSEVITNATGATTTGPVSISFWNIGGTDVTVNGKTLPAGAAISFPYLGRNITYGSIPYNAFGGLLRIDRTDF